MKISDILKENNLHSKKIEKIGKALIIYTDKGKFVIKNSHIDDSILSYLRSRSFDYLPDIIVNGDYNMTSFVDELVLPDEQKILDLVKIVSLLHSKTTHYTEVDTENNEKIYNHLMNNINYLYSYYTDLITIIESKVFMSPSDLLFASNITKLYDVLDSNKLKLERWHKLVSEKKRERRVVIHNNLSLSHFIRNEKSYLINWDRSRIDSPVFDLFKLYKNNNDFINYLKIYEKHYPLLDDERLLLELLIEIPDDTSISGTEYQKCILINNILNRFLPKRSEKGEKEKSK